MTTRGRRPALLAALLAAPADAADGNRLAYLGTVDPYYPSRHFPKLVTPQRIGEEGVDAVVVLAIDAGITHAGTLRASV